MSEFFGSVACGVVAGYFGTWFLGYIAGRIHENHLGRRRRDDT